MNMPTNRNSAESDINAGPDIDTKPDIDTAPAIGTNAAIEWIISSPRLRLRRLSYEDFHWLKRILQNEEVMYAWEHGFSDEEVYEWIEKNLTRYENEGFSYFAAFRASSHAAGADFQIPVCCKSVSGKSTSDKPIFDEPGRFDEPVGVIGPLIETIEDAPFTGIAYILDKPFWHQGYATEGARACIDYAFNTLCADRVIAEIRPDNLASRRVAERLGMQVEGEFIKRYREKDMPHLIYAIYPASIE